MSIREFIAEQLRATGFIAAGDGTFTRQQGEHHIHAELDFGSKRSVLGLRYWIELRAADEERGAYRSAGKSLSAPVELTVRRRGWQDGLGTILGLNAELPVPAEYAEMIYVESRAPNAEVAPLLSPRLLRVADALARDFCRLHLNDHLGRLVVIRHDLLRHLDPQTVRNHGRHLVAAYEALPPFRAVTSGRPGGPDRVQRVALLLVFCALLGTLALMASALFVEGRATCIALPSPRLVGGLVVFGVLLLAGWRTRGSSVGLRRFALLLVPTLLAAAVWATTAYLWLTAGCPPSP
ncbi:MAG: hypothetical protein AAGN82_21535 [Myxococcota bacterium]